VRVDAGVAEGGSISVFYDPMIAKVIATAETRSLAIERLAAALREFVIEGITTNIPFLLTLLARDEFSRGGVDTGFLDRETIIVDGRVNAPPPGKRRPAVRDEPGAFPPASYDPWSGAGAVRNTPAAAPVKRRGAGAAGANVTAPMPATVVKVQVNAGDAVKKGDALLVLEAMKMELPVRAPGDAIVKAVRCRPGDMVAADAVLVEFVDARA
jgi:acetyl-CoA/propionyl-CoA carboxylase biotin carboxyl carrier protein